MSPKTIRLLLLLSIAYVITMTWQVWIGQPFVYGANPVKAAILHQAILENRSPPGVTWEQMGANGTNIRRVNVVLGEAVHRASGLPLARAYFLLDTVFIFATLVLLGFYLSRWFDPTWVALGLLFYGTVGSMTYLFHFFHPWDRLSQLVWLVALFFLRDRRALGFGVALAFGVTVKYDVVPLALAWAAWTWRGERRTAWALQAAVMGGIGFGILQILGWAYPGGFSVVESTLGERVMHLLGTTWGEVRARGFAFPPLLMFGLPVALAIAGWRHLERFHKITLILGVSLFAPFALMSHLREVRAQVPAMLLILPGALVSLRALLQPAAPAAQAEDSPLECKSA